MRSLVFLALLLQAGCSSLPTHKPLSPSVQISNIDIISFGLSSQKLAVTLDVFNPNQYDLPVNTLQFTAFSEQQAFASGDSQQRVLLTANTNTPLTINVTARANRVLRKLLTAFVDKNNQLDYTVTGFVKLDNWPARIPFDVEKTLSLDSIGE